MLMLSCQDFVNGMFVFINGDNYAVRGERLMEYCFFGKLSHHLYSQTKVLH